MKAITVRAPWASLILEGDPTAAPPTIKDVENRRWQTAYRGPLLIHSAVKWDEWFVEAEYLARNPWYSDRATATRGAIIGVVDLAAVDDWQARRSPWAEWEGVHRWRLADPRPFAQPVPWRGQQGLWDVNVSASGLLREQLKIIGFNLWKDEEHE